MQKNTIPNNVSQILGKWYYIKNIAKETWSNGLIVSDTTNMISGTYIDSQANGRVSEKRMYLFGSASYDTINYIILNNQIGHITNGYSDTSWNTIQTLTSDSLILYKKQISIYT